MIINSIDYDTHPSSIAVQDLTDDVSEIIRETNGNKKTVVYGPSASWYDNGGIRIRTSKMVELTFDASSPISQDLNEIIELIYARQDLVTLQLDEMNRVMGKLTYIGKEGTKSLFITPNFPTLAVTGLTTKVVLENKYLSEWTNITATYDETLGVLKLSSSGYDFNERTNVYMPYTVILQGYIKKYTVQTHRSYKDWYTGTLVFEHNVL